MGIVVTIAHKEILEAISAAMRDKNVWISLAVMPIAVILLALQSIWTGPETWAWTSLVFLPALATLLAAFLATEGYTGERERHTLDTLLASPASEIQIFLGKVTAHFVIVMGIVLVVAALQILVVFMVDLRFLTVVPLWSVLGVMLLLAVHLFLFMEAAGVFIGQRSSTMVGANAAIMPFFFIPAAAVGVFVLTGDDIMQLLQSDLEGQVRSIVNYTIGACYGGLALMFPFIWTRNRAHRLMEGS